MFKALLIPLTFVCTLATLGYDISLYPASKLTTSNLECLVKSGGQFFMIESYDDDGFANENFASAYKSLYQAGAKLVDTYATICIYYSPDKLCSSVKSVLPDNFNGTVWLSINTYGDGCFGGTYTKFLETLENYVKTCQSYGFKVGIYGRASSYNARVAGDKIKVSPFLTTLPLRYEKYDKEANFDDFGDFDAGFGGWEMPTVKKYQGYQTICEAPVGFNFRAPMNDKNKNLVFE